MSHPETYTAAEALERIAQADSPYNPEALAIAVALKDAHVALASLLLSLEAHNRYANRKTDRALDAARFAAGEVLAEAGHPYPAGEELERVTAELAERGPFIPEPRTEPDPTSTPAVLYDPLGLMTPNTEGDPT